MLKRTHFLLLFGMIICASSLAQEKWDLRKAVEYALANNISIRQQDIQTKIAELTYKQSDLSKYPNLNFSSNAGINTGRSIDRTTNQFTTESILYNTFGLQSNLDVFNWFSKKNTIAGNLYEARASQAALDKLKNDVVLNVAAAYLQALLAKEQVFISKVQIGQTTAQLNNTQKQVDAGNLPELNVAELEAQLARDSTSLITANGTETQSLLLLKSLLNLDAATSFDIVVPSVELIPLEPIADLQPEAVYKSAIANLPQQRMNSLRSQAAQKFADAAKGFMYPSISLGGTLQTNYSNSKNNYRIVGTTINGFDTIGFVGGSTTPVITPKIIPNVQFFSNPYGTQFGDNFSNGIGFNITVPIFNGRSARTNWEKQKLNVKSLSLQQDLDNSALKQNIYSAYTDAITAMQKFNAATKGIETAQKAYDFAQKRYAIGLLNTIDLITNQNNLFRAKIDQLAAQFDYLFKMKVLEFYKGQGLKL